MVMGRGRDSLYSKLLANKLTARISKDNHMAAVQGSLKALDKDRGKDCE